MRSTLNAVAAVLLLGSVAAADTTRTGSRTQSFGNDRWGTSVRRSMVAGHGGTTGRFDCSTTFDARLAGRRYRAAEVQRNASGQGLGGSARGFDRSKLTIANSASFTIGLTFTHNVSIATFATPVFIGPFMFNVQGQAGLTFEVRGFVGRQGDAVVVGREGSASIGGTLGVGLGPPGASIGVEGQLNLVKASLPATCSMRRTGVTYEVSFVLESSVEVKAFCQVGWGPFSKKWTVDVPFMKYTFGQRTYPISSGTLRR